MATLLTAILCLFYATAQKESNKNI